MPIFGQYTGGDAFNVGQNMDALLQQQQARDKAMLAMPEQIVNAENEMEVLRGTASSILSQYSTDEKGKPSDSAPKYIHDIYKSINKEGGLGYLSKSQLVATLEGYKTGAMVEEQALKTRAAQQQYSINQLSLNKAQLEYDEYQKMLLAHKLAFETAGSNTGKEPTTGSTTSSRMMDAVAKFSPAVGEAAMTLAPQPIGIVAGAVRGLGRAGQQQATATAPAPATAPTPVQQAGTPTQSKTLEYRVPPAGQAEVEAQKEKLKQQALQFELESLQGKLVSIDKALRGAREMSGAEMGWSTVSGFVGNTFGGGFPEIGTASKLAGNVLGFTGNLTPEEKQKEAEAQLAKLTDLQAEKTKAQARIAEIQGQIKSPAEPEKPKETPKPAGATPLSPYQRKLQILKEIEDLKNAVVYTVFEKDKNDAKIQELSKELIEVSKATLSPEDALAEAKNNLAKALAASKPPNPADAIKDGNIAKTAAEYEKQRGRKLFDGSWTWNRGASLGDETIQLEIGRQYQKDTGIDILRMFQQGTATDADKKAFFEWTDQNSIEGKLEQLQMFAKTNYDAWQFTIDNAKRQVELLSKVQKPAEKPKPAPTAQAAQMAPQASSSPVPTSIAPAGSKATQIQRQQEKTVEKPTPPVVGQPELKSDDEKIAEEYGQLTSRLQKMGGVPMNWSESTFRQMRGYPPKVRVMTSNGVTLVGIGEKWEVMQGKGASVSDQIALEKHAILKSAIRVDGLTTAKWSFKGDIRTTETSEASKVKTSVLDTVRAIEAIDRVIEMADIGLWDSITPNEKSGIILGITNSIQAAGRTEVAGSGAFSEQDAKKLESVVPNIATMSGAIFRKTALGALKEYRFRMSEKVKGMANANGFAAEESGSSGLTQEQEALLRLKYNEYIEQGVPAQQARQRAINDVFSQ